ncbi:MAG: hypothetical protein Q8O11_02930 [Syntrophales bacterium]|nr:hypothetical protein [Syntrophales bacterium]
MDGFGDADQQRHSDHEVDAHKEDEDVLRSDPSQMTSADKARIALRIILKNRLMPTHLPICSGGASSLSMAATTLGINHWIVIVILVAAFIALFRWFEKKGL